MALTENEQKLLDGFVWLRNIHHVTQHRKLIEEHGQVDPKDCDARSCKYANEIIAWAEAQT